MLKKTFLLIVILLVSSCGYKAIHSKKSMDNYNFSISTLNFVGDRDINLKIKEKLNNYFMLEITSLAKKEIVARNISGDPTSFKSTVIIDIKVSVESKLKNNLQIVENFNYNNNDNKFDLKKYEREIKNNLTETAIDKLIYKLSNIQ